MTGRHRARDARSACSSRSCSNRRRWSARTVGSASGSSIVKSLVEAHGGTVSAHSDGLGRGSTFVVELPALEVARGRRPAARGRADASPRPGAPRRCASSSSTTTATPPTSSQIALECARPLGRDRVRRPVGARDREDARAADRARRHRASRHGRLPASPSCCAPRTTSRRRDHRLRPGERSPALARRGLRALTS